MNMIKVIMAKFFSSGVKSVNLLYFIPPVNKPITTNDININMVGKIKEKTFSKIPDKKPNV